MNDIWECKIGATDKYALPEGADAPMRAAVRGAYFALTGHDPDYIFSGWGSELTEDERRALEEAPVANKERADEHARLIDSDLDVNGDMTVTVTCTDGKSWEVDNE